MAEPKIKGGYILLSRKLIESEIFAKPPLYLKVWIYLLSKAQHKDFKDLKRGQVRTSIPEIQKACSWHIGYRKVVPTKDQVFQILQWMRSPYEVENERVTKATTRATMITTTRATRGMLVTIDKYSVYQDPKNYESNSESNDEHDDGSNTYNIQECNKNDHNNDNNNIYSAKNEQNAQLAENIWKLYPCKKGKARAIQKIPKLIQKYGYEQIENTVFRYKKYVQHRRETDFKDLKYQNGSTFFGGTYVDYLDENYTEESEQNNNVQMFDFSDD